MNTIITIGRQYGSGGREIGQKIADHYGIKFYDRELLARVAKDSGFCKEIIQFFWPSLRRSNPWPMRDPVCLSAAARMRLCWTAKMS